MRWPAESWSRRRAGSGHSIGQRFAVLEVQEAVAQGEVKEAVLPLFEAREDALFSRRVGRLLVFENGRRVEFVRDRGLDFGSIGLPADPPRSSGRICALRALRTSTANSSGFRASSAMCLAAASAACRKRAGRSPVSIVVSTRTISCNWTRLRSA
jgi:hypothetical protein